MNREEALRRLWDITEGINKQESISDQAWWETSIGAKFGQMILTELEHLIEDLTI